MRPPLKIPLNLKFKTLRWRLLRWRLTLSDVSIVLQSRQSLRPPKKPFRTVAQKSLKFGIDKNAIAEDDFCRQGKTGRSQNSTSLAQRVSLFFGTVLLKQHSARLLSSGASPANDIVGQRSDAVYQHLSLRRPSSSNHAINYMLSGLGLLECRCTCSSWA